MADAAIPPAALDKASGRRKVALITGVTGQDGSYLAELLLDKGYIVHGMKRRASSYNHPRLEHIMDKSYPNSERFHLHYADLIDFGSLCAILRDTAPQEVYNLGAQSHVQVSFQLPQYTADASGVGVMNLLEAIRATGLEASVRVYQASTSELYGKVHAVPQDEETPFHPRSPYAVAKLYGFWAIKNYREAYNIYACNGILFNHESPRRGEIFVTRKARRRAWVAPGAGFGLRASSGSVPASALGDQAHGGASAAWRSFTNTCAARASSCARA